MANANAMKLWAIAWGASRIKVKKIEDIINPGGWEIGLRVSHCFAETEDEAKQFGIDCALVVFNQNNSWRQHYARASEIPAEIRLVVPDTRGVQQTLIEEAEAVEAGSELPDTKADKAKVKSAKRKPVKR